MVCKFKTQTVASANKPQHRPWVKSCCPRTRGTQSRQKGSTLPPQDLKHCRFAPRMKDPLPIADIPTIEVKNMANNWSKIYEISSTPRDLLIMGMVPPETRGCLKKSSTKCFFSRKNKSVNSARMIAPSPRIKRQSFINHHSPWKFTKLFSLSTSAYLKFHNIIVPLTPLSMPSCIKIKFLSKEFGKRPCADYLRILSRGLAKS